MEDCCPTYLTTSGADAANKKGGADAANKKGENKKQGEGVIIKFWSQYWCPTSLTTSGVDATN